LDGRKRKPSAVPGWERDAEEKDLSAAFEKAVEAAGGTCCFYTRTQRTEGVQDLGKRVCMIDTAHASIVLPERLEETEVAVIEGRVGVAENGAVWIDPQERYPRALLTLAEKLIVVLPKEHIVATMHEAYDKIDMGLISYGVFISGPSKTADIEQALVLGAHGAISLEVWIIQEECG